MEDSVSLVASERGSLVCSGFMNCIGLYELTDRDRVDGLLYACGMGGSSEGSIGGDQ
jgi:hypothetical protein